MNIFPVDISKKNAELMVLSLNRWWISSEEENNFWACAASSTPGGLTSDVIGSTSVLVRDLWMDRKRSFDNLLLQDCSSFLNVKAANSTNF